jgi:hypothetical protein
MQVVLSRFTFNLVVNNFAEVHFKHTPKLFRIHSQFRACLQKVWGSRPAGLAVKGIRTDSIY